MTKETIRQCFAYGPAGQRCDHPAGHPGDHAITATWTDNECVHPLAMGQATVHINQPGPLVTEVSDKPTGPLKCAACNHAHRDGECKCGCYSFIG